MLVLLLLVTNTLRWLLSVGTLPMIVIYTTTMTTCGNRYSIIYYNNVSYLLII